MKKISLAIVALVVLAAPAFGQGFEALKGKAQSGNAPTCNDISLADAPTDYKTVNVLIPVDGINVPDENVITYKVEVNIRPEMARTDNNWVKGAQECSYGTSSRTLFSLTTTRIVVGGNWYFGAAIPLRETDVSSVVEFRTKLNNDKVYYGSWTAAPDGTPTVILRTGLNAATFTPTYPLPVRRTP